MGTSSLRTPGALPAFASGHFARSLIWSFTDLLLGYYAHVRLGLPAWQTGLLLSVSLAYSSVLDLALAMVFMRMPHQKRRVPRLQRIGGVTTAFSGVLLFIPVSGGTSHVLAWLICASFLFRTSYALCDLTQNALTSLLPADPTQATRFVTVRAVMATTAKLCVAASGFLVIDEAATWGRELVVASAMGMLIVASAFWLGRQRPVGGLEERTVRAWSDFPAMRLAPLLMATAASCVLALPGRFLPFAIDPATGRPLGAALVFAMVLGSVGGPFVATRLVRAGMARAAIVFGATAAGSATVLIAAPALPVQVVMAVVYGVGLGGGSVLVWNEVSRVVREHAAQTGQRTDLACFALLTMTIKMSLALSTILLGRYLDGFGLRRPDTLVELTLITLLGAIGFVLPLSINGRRSHRHAALADARSP